MDTDGPGTFDFIFYKGKGIKAVSCEVMGKRPKENDPTIYGSDHCSVVAELEIASFTA